MIDPAKMVVKVREYLDEFRKGIKIKGSFTRNFAITASGNAVSLVIGFVFTPFIARVYGPEIYGVFALFTAVVNSLAPLSTLQFPSGYVAARDQNEFHNLILITMLVIIGGTFLVTGVIFVFYDIVFRSLSDISIERYAFFIPLYFFFMGIDNMLVGWNIRIKEFERSAVTKILSVVVSKGITLVAGIVRQPTPLGMVVGNLLVYPLESTFKLSGKLRNEFKNLLDARKSDIVGTLKRFKGYPLYSAPGLVISNLASQLPIYFFSLAFAPSYAGYFALAGSLVSVPLSIVVNSSTTVFLQKAAELQQEADAEVMRDYVHNLYKRLFFISIFPLVLFALSSDYIFQVVFGEVWKPAGVFAGFIAITSVFGVSSQPISVLFRLKFRERLNFILNISQIAAKAAVLWIGTMLVGDIYVAVILFCAVNLLGNFVVLYFTFRISQMDTRILFRDLAVTATLFILLIAFKL